MMHPFITTDCAQCELSEAEELDRLIAKLESHFETENTE